MDQTPNLQLPYLMAAQSQKHVTHNDAIRMLDALLQIGVASRSVTAPPASPVEGVRYIVPTGATGVWAGTPGQIAAFQDGAWAYFVPRDGWMAWVGDAQQAVVYAGSTWTSITGNASTLGINATADTTNRLVVASPASLFNNVGAGHQVKVNKANAASTASLLYQDGYSGRAEMGLMGDDDFHIKVSADGNVWREGMVVSATTGRATFPYGGIVEQRSASVTVTVPTQAATIQAALDQLMSYRFEGNAQGIVIVNNGTYALSAPLACRHPQPGRIVIRAATAATLPVEGDFTGTKATDEAMVRTKYKVVVEGANVGCLTCSNGEGVGLVQDIAFVRTGATGSPTGVSAARLASIALDRCAIFGFNNNVLSREGGQVITSNSAVAYSAASGTLIQQGGFVRATGTLVASSGAYGVEVVQSHFASDAGLRIKTSASAGLSLVSGSRAALVGANLSGNTGSSVSVQGGSMLDVSASTLSGGAGQAALSLTDGSTASLTTLATSGDATQRSFVAQRVSVQATSGTHAGAPVFSPALGTSGNNGAWTL